MEKMIKKIGINALEAAKKKIDSRLKNKVLIKFSKLIKKNQKKIIIQNIKDIRFAKNKKLKENLIKRLELSPSKINEMIKSINKISKLKSGTFKIELDKTNKEHSISSSSLQKSFIFLKNSHD